MGGYVAHHLLIRGGLGLVHSCELLLHLLESSLELLLANEGDTALAEFLHVSASARTSTIHCIVRQLTVKNGFIAASFSLPSIPSIRVNLRSTSLAWREISFASCPVTATTRRIPFAIELSSVMTRSLMLSVFWTCLESQLIHHHD